MTLEEIGVGIIVLLFYIGVKRLINYNRNRLYKKGISVLAEVLRIDDTGISIDSGGTDRQVKDLILLIQEEGPFKGKRLAIRQSFDTQAPGLGDSVTVLIDPKAPDNGLIISH
ncbi:hypothetical protein [Desertivirga brevis]|uniref:hypothetical protein n=1 Tax=Desertivirga brevis TaxID=2810310 RepID=UPI001A959327|nr:hypothetical protein [Pedobacter sp. SYSU D00873]